MPPPVTRKATGLFAAWLSSGPLFYPAGVAARTVKNKHRLAGKPKSDEPLPRPIAENLSLFPNPISAEAGERSNPISSVPAETANEKSIRKSPPRSLPRTGQTATDNAERRNNWLAPAGSLQERRMFEKLAKQQGLEEKDRALVYAYLAKPDGFAERNALFWHAAKKQILGPVVYDTALRRHKELSPAEWLVACLISQGFKQDEIASMVVKALPTIEKTIASIKEKIRQEFKYASEAVTLGEIVRWFLGL